MSRFGEKGKKSGRGDRGRAKNTLRTKRKKKKITAKQLIQKSRPNRGSPEGFGQRKTAKITSPRKRAQGERQGKNLRRNENRVLFSFLQERFLYQLHRLETKETAGRISRVKNHPARKKRRKEEGKEGFDH